MTIAPTLEEAKLIQEFRKLLIDVLETEERKQDSFLIRWIRARDHDLDKAEKLLRDSLTWRKENNVDKVLDVKVDSFLENEFPYCLKGPDKNGNPVLVIPMGRWDLRKVAQEGKVEEFKVYVNQMFERIEAQIRENNKNRKTEEFPLTQFTAFVDWSGYSYMQLANIRAVQKILHMACVYEAHYPEVLLRCFFVGCPSFFSMVLSLLKPVLAPKTMAKISSHGSDRAEWEKVTEEFIGKDEIKDIIETYDEVATA